ncbi:hypothetical protein IC582_016908 [Cucumis melo]|uniref:Subtilisin-like protease SBT2.5 n=2 Tax=Cucumis melo TaxID=3656 RepID=A0A5D3D232_CUCMM|nr:uncharacterized protein LOC103493088 [Cucumis melo]KAA0044911.1 subtilisin-like protease SBT2.5 [Cucumis melo var. makuwa]TYK16559.1 subtilisin-like protease SBT2.5 [Cucumis melo var. makuwa]
MQENRYNGAHELSGGGGGGRGGECYFVFMKYDPEYERLRADRCGEGADEVDGYLSRKHDEVLRRWLEPGSYRKISSFLIVDGFSVEINEHQANVLRSAEGVRVVEKNQDQPLIVNPTSTD